MRLLRCTSSALLVSLIYILYTPSWLPVSHILSSSSCPIHLPIPSAKIYISISIYTIYYILYTLSHIPPPHIMTSLEPRPPYTPEEIQRLYPSSLQLKLVQVIFRHGTSPHLCSLSPLASVLAILCVGLERLLIRRHWYLSRRTYTSRITISGCWSPGL